MGRNFYNTLKLPLDATAEEIRAAYFEAARKYHPDANPDADAQSMFIDVQEAYAVLSNPVRRQAYDAALPDQSKRKLPINLEILSSESSVREMDEDQLIYLLVNLACGKMVDDLILAPVHVCLIIDHSTSMRGRRLDMVIANVRHLLQKLQNKDLISIVAFSDRAEVVVQPTEAQSIHSIESALTLLEASGGTEILQGLKAGLKLIQSTGSADTLKQLILITDGHTYGDESACLALAEEARQEGIPINALGIGDEWNDTFLDRLAASSGGNAVYVRSPENLYNFIDDKFRSINVICARQVDLYYQLGEGIELTYAFRIQPDITPLEIKSPLPLGNLDYGKKTSLILELKVSPLAGRGTSLKIINGKILMDIPSSPISVARIEMDVECPWNNLQAVSRPPQPILQAMSKLSLYRLQEKAKNDMASGDIRKATLHLEYLATHLLTQGKRDLAKSVLLEADHIQRTHHYSKDGEKKIKYETRSLFLLTGPEQAQT